MRKQVVTLGFEKGTKVENIKLQVRALRNNGFEVYAPFYVMYDLGEIGLRAVKECMKESIKNSDIFYILNDAKENPGSNILEELREYAENNHKIIYNAC